MKALRKYWLPVLLACAVFHAARVHAQGQEGTGGNEAQASEKKVDAEALRAAWENAPEGLSLESRFSRLRSLAREADHDEAVKGFEGFAAAHPGHDLAAEVHLEIVGILLRKKDLTGAIKRIRHVMSAFPRSRKRQYAPLGYMPGRLSREWREYVERHPIRMVDYGWYALAGVFTQAGLLEDALDAYNHILATVEPEELPDTRNLAIVMTFRLHKQTSKNRIALLRKMGREAAADEAAVEHEKVYPSELGKAANIKASRALDDYVKESKRAREQREEAKE